MRHGLMGQYLCHIFLHRIAKREKYSRRRMHNDDADIDYINERNMKFNKKLERFYGEHTTEIKQNLERGTAVWTTLLCKYFPLINWNIDLYFSKFIYMLFLHLQNI